MYVYSNIFGQPQPLVNAYVLYSTHEYATHYKICVTNRSLNTFTASELIIQIAHSFAHSKSYCGTDRRPACDWMQAHIW